MTDEQYRAFLLGNHPFCSRRIVGQLPSAEAHLIAEALADSMQGPKEVGVRFTSAIDVQRGAAPNPLL
jgi:hypothetical protein